MEITKTLVESILKTLPISYYAGRDVDVRLDEKSPSSYYEVYEDRITISFVNVLMMMKELQGVEHVEPCIRGLLYHEISHAMLTPEYLISEASCINPSNEKMSHDIMNIFEDERIETIFKKKFYGVDFKRNIILLNNWKGEPPKDVIGAFYNIVRFRTDYVEGRMEFLKRVPDIINAYRSMTKEYSSYGTCSRYVKEIGKLFWDIAKDWMEQNDKASLEEAMGGQQGEDGSTPKYDGASEEEQKEAVKKAVEKQAKEGKLGKGYTQDEDGKDGELIFSGFEKGQVGKDGKEIIIKGVRVKPTGCTTDPENDIPEVVELSEEELAKLLKAIEEIEEQTDPENPTDKEPVKCQRIFQTSMNKFVDNNLTDRISEIFENFLSRNKNNSSAMCRYSGIMNPRMLATRDDWRIWTYKSKDGPIKGYDNLHLNLFIDTSGSFCDNEDKTNTILKSLNTLEGKYPFFSFDLVTCQVGETLRTKDQRYVRTYGGNNLDRKVWKIYKDLQLPNSFNYNIILFDGDAFSDCRGYRSESEKNFGAFNSSKCSIISDDDNEKAIRRYAPQAHSIFVNGRSRGRRSYSELLFENVLDALNRALL